MDKIIVKDLNIGTSTNADGCILKLALVPYFVNGNSVCVSFMDTTPMSSSFYNSSFSELIDTYGYEKFKKTVAIADITKSHFELIKKYISWQMDFVTV
jgi:hypothetical protein